MLGEEVEELEHGGGDAVAEALIREFLAYRLQSSEALPRAKDRGGSILPFKSNCFLYHLCPGV